MSGWRRGKAYSQDLRDRVLSADGMGSGQVAGRFGVSASYVVKARQRRDRLGEMTPGAQRSHTSPKLAGHEDAIIAQVTRQPDMTLDELRGCTLQVVRDWVLRFNVHGPERLIDGKAPGQPSLLNAAHRAALIAMVENGPIPAVHGVVRWRIIDLCQWMDMMVQG